MPTKYDNNIIIKTHKGTSILVDSVLYMHACISPVKTETLR